MRRPVGYPRPASSLKPSAEPSSNHGPVTSWPGLPLRIPLGSVKDTPSGQRYGRGRHDRRRPVRGTSACAWNIAVRTRGVFTHRDDFQKPACAERGLVRTGTAPIISESAVAWTFLVITPATVGREESLSASSPQRPICSRRRPYIPAAVPAQWLRLLILGNPDITATSHSGGDNDLAAGQTFLLSRDTFRAVRAVADKALIDKQMTVLPVAYRG